MTQRPAGTIPVDVELGNPVAALAAAEHTAEISKRLDHGLAELLVDLGVPGHPAIEVHPADSSRVLRLRVHGRVQPSSADLMQRAWVAVAPPDVWDLPRSHSTRTHAFPDGWFATYVAEIAGQGGDAGWRVAVDFIVRWLVETIRQRPGCLVERDQAILYESSNGDGRPTSQKSAAEVSAVLASLLNLGISLKERTDLLAILRSGRDSGRSVEDIVEAAFARLRPAGVEIHVHPQDLESLVLRAPADEPLPVYASSIDDRFKESFRMMEDGLFYELGVRLPGLSWVPNPDIRSGTFAVKINDLLKPPWPLLPAGKLLVNQTVSGLQQMGIPAQKTVNPAYGNEIALVDESSAETLAQAGLTIWNRLGAVVLTLYGELLRQCFRVLDANEVELQMAQLEQAFPELVHVVMERFTIEDITRVLRGLIREGVSLRNLRAILEKLLQYDSLRLDASQLILFDDRLPLAEERADILEHRWTSYREFVRSGLKHPISQKVARGGTLTVYLMDPILEAAIADRVLDSEDVSLDFDDSEVEALRDAVWAEVGSEGAPSPRSVILTHSGIRAALRELLAPEFPDLSVIAYTELRPDQNIQPVARISLPQGG